MVRKTNIKIFLLTIVFCQLIKAQNTPIEFTLVKGPEGKPTGKITSITQDRYGYLWIAGQSEHTLYKYDGSNWWGFGIDNANPDALKATTLEIIYADNAGMIWVGGNGLDQLNPATGKFRHYRNQENDPGSLSSNDVVAILKDRQGRLWVGTTKGLDRLDDKAGKFIHYNYEKGNSRSLSSNWVRTIFEDKKGVIWIGTGNTFSNDLEEGGLNRLDSGFIFTRFLHDPKNPQSLGNNKIRSIFEDSRGKLWLGTGKMGLYTMDRKTGSFENRYLRSDNSGQQNSKQITDIWKFNHEQVSFICEDNRGGIWTGSMWSGIHRYDTLTKKFTLYNSANGFPDTSSWTGYLSRDGVLWIGTEDSHVLYKSLLFPKSINKINTGTWVRDFLESNNNLWISTNKGLLQYDLQNGLQKKFNHDPLDTLSLITDGVTSLLGVGSDTIWFGSDSGVGVFNIKTRQFSKFALGLSSNDPETRVIWDIFRDSHHGIWFATGEGAFRYDQKDGSTMHYQNNEKDTGSILGNRITEILESRSGDLWIANAGGGGNQGINRLISGTKKFRHYLKGYLCSYLYEDVNGGFWACTTTGLYKYDTLNDNFSSFFESQSPLSNTWIYSLLEDDKNNLWFTTSSIIGKIVPDRKGYVIFGNKFGIPADILSPKSAQKTNKGQLLIGNLDGFYAFYPEDLKVSSAPEITITSFYINDIEVVHEKTGPFQKPIEEISSIELKYDQKNLAFNFIAIDFSSPPESVKYYTILEGYDNTWRESLQRRTSFYNLSPGNYLFRIKAFTSEGMKIEKYISIHVNPPWWKTWWAYSFYILIAGLLLYAVYRLQKQRIIRKEREKSQLIELEQAKEIEKAYHELRATQAQLIHAEKMASLGELTAGIAHEIQNPLNFVNNFSEVNIELADELKSELNKIELSPEDKNNLETYVDDIAQNQVKINEHGHRAGAIVKSMLQHSRASTGQKELTDINALAEEYLRISYHGMRAKDKSLTEDEAGYNIILKTDFDPGIGKINVIPQDIGRVLLNVYNNAFYAVSEKIKQAPSGYVPEVSVKTSKIADKIKIYVKDNGNGIPEKIIVKIFQPFFTTKPTGQGTGLGLSLSYDIIKAHGGKINVESKPDSEGLDSGTMFSIELPS